MARSVYGWAVFEKSTGMLIEGSEHSEKQDAIDSAKAFLAYTDPFQVRRTIEAAIEAVGGSRC